MTKNYPQWIGQVMGLLCLMAGFGIVGYLIYKNREIDPSPKNEVWCASIVYYNNHFSSFDTTYSSATVFNTDSIVNFIDPDGHKWWCRDFISNEDRKDEDGIDYNDITLKNGQRFKVFTVSDGKCQTKAIEDSIKSSINDSDDAADDN